MEAISLGECASILKVYIQLNIGYQLGFQAFMLFRGFLSEVPQSLKEHHI